MTVNPQAAADHEAGARLRATSTDALLRAAYTLTHRIDACATARREERVRGDRGAEHAAYLEGQEAREQRDAIHNEILRRTGEL